jgi:hypothetical protein
MSMTEDRHNPAEESALSNFPKRAGRQAEAFPFGAQKTDSEAGAAPFVEK